MYLIIICERSILRLLYSNASTTIYAVSLSHFYLLETFFDVHNLTVLVTCILLSNLSIHKQIH